jgi:hypothetical protein
MSNEEKATGQTMGKSKLLKLKKWLTIPEAARHLSNLFDEEVSEADVLRLALDRHLKLSVNFVNQVYGKRGKLIAYADEENLPAELRSIFATLPEELKAPIVSGFKGLGPFDEHFVYLDEKITTIDGVWDLPMVAGQQYVIEKEYQKLSGGPEAIKPIMGRTYFVREGGWVCQLYEEFDESFPVNTKNKSDSYYPSAAILPNDSVLVVRTSALLDLQERVSEEQAGGKTISPKVEKSNLHIIGALLQIVMDKKLFASEEALREHLAAQYQSYPGCAERTLAGRFAEAKKLLSE